MDNAVNAVNKLFSGAAPVAEQTPEKKVTRSSTKAAASTAPVSTDQDVDSTVDTEVAPAVEHTHVKKQHETREQTVIEKEKHQDHYHTTIQPLKDTEVLPEKHDAINEVKHRNINKDDGAAAAKAQAEIAGLENTRDEKQFESKTKEQTQVGEHVHHHLHETVVPVIEKEIIDPSVTHKRIDVKEKIQEASEYHGATTNAAMSVEDFEKKLAQAKN